MTTIDVMRHRINEREKRDAWEKEHKRRLEDIWDQLKTLAREINDCYQVRVNGDWDEQMARCNMLVEKMSQLER